MAKQLCKVKVKVTLEESVKVQRGSSGIALLFNLGATWDRWLTGRLGLFKTVPVLISAKLINNNVAESFFGF